MRTKKDYSGCAHPNCDECRCKDCIIDHKRDFKELGKFRRERCEQIQSADTPIV